jgi:hypothetical protein
MALSTGNNELPEETGSWTRGVTGRSGAAKFLLVSQASRNNILGNTSNERTEI